MRFIVLQQWSEQHVRDGNVIIKGAQIGNVLPFDVVLFSAVEVCCLYFHLAGGVLTLVKVTGSIDLTNFAFKVDAYLLIPFWGKVHLGGTHGDLQHGVTLEIDLAGIAKGSVTFYLKGADNLWAHFELDTIIGNWSTDVFLITI